jgi:hypothetical protein
MILRAAIVLREVIADAYDELRALAISDTWPPLPPGC